jgi:8-oxo-dGTP diphosphatase
MLYLVRHGSAGVRNDADPADTERHLDTGGLRQAVHLAHRLAPIGGDGPEIDRVVSSPAARCVETVEPLASSVGVDIDIDDRLFEGADVEDSWALVEELVEAGITAVLSSHGDIIPDIVKRAKGRGMHVPGKAGCSKGSLWILEWDGEAFTDGAYEPNPA